VPNRNISSAPNINSNKKVLKIVIIIFSPILLYIISRLLVLFVISPYYESGNKTDRQKVINQAKTNFEEIDSKTELKSYATSTADGCSKSISLLGLNLFPALGGGDYYERCVFKISKYYGFSGDFKIKAEDLDKMIRKIWLSNGTTMSRTLNYYYDGYIGKNISYNPGNVKIYYVSNLPSVDYKKDGFKMKIRFAQKETPREDIDDLNNEQNYKSGSVNDVTYSDKKLVDTSGIFNKIIAENKYFMMITMSKEY
jgi:hypothetical protein